jgi:hypothetical protein
MVKGFAIGAVALVAFILMDQHYLSHGKYTDAMFAMLRQIYRSFG